MENKLNRKILHDKELTCIDCGEQFLFSVGEQCYFLSKELTEPKRCTGCRAIRNSRIVKAVGYDSH